MRDARPLVTILTLSTNVGTARYRYRRLRAFRYSRKAAVAAEAPEKTADGAHH